MEKHILLMSDMPGFGKVASAAMNPILSYMGIGVFGLPTALISNTLNYGKYALLDTTAYMKDALSTWDTLGFRYEAIATGFVLNKAQAEFITQFCTQKAQNGILIFCDPIFADHGTLYHGRNEQTLSYMRKLISCADYIVPNYTEAVFLAGEPYREATNRANVLRLLQKLREIGAKSIAITSVCIDGVHQVCCYDAAKDAYFYIPYERIPMRIPGTGDIFSAVMLGNLLKHADMAHSVAHAVNAVSRIINASGKIQDPSHGIAVESCLNAIDPV